MEIPKVFAVISMDVLPVRSVPTYIHVVRLNILLKHGTISYYKHTGQRRETRMARKQ